MIKKRVKATLRFSQQMQAMGFTDLNALLKDIAHHLSYEDLSVSYLGRIGDLNDPPWASSVNLGHIHIWDSNNPLFTIDKQNKWNTSTNVYNKTSDTCIVYSAHWEKESDILLMGIATPCHGAGSQLYNSSFMDYFRIEGEAFQNE